MRSFPRSTDKRIAQLSEIFGVVAVFVLVIMMMLTVTDVTLRYIFNRPIMASKELTEYMMVTVGFLGIGWCAFKGMHVKVDLIVGRLSPKIQAISDTVNNILVIGLSIFIAVQNFSESFSSRDLGRASDITGIPDFPFYLVIAFAYLLLLVVLIPITVKSVRGVLNK